MRKNILFLLSVFIIAGVILAGCQPAAETAAAEPAAEEAAEAPAAEEVPTEFPRNETIYVSGAAWGPASTWNPF